MSPTVIESQDARRTSAVAASPQQLLHRCLSLVAEGLVAVEDELRRLLHSSVTVIPELGGSLAFAGGKRFRPLLTLLSSEAAGYRDPRRITIAAVGELLHTATLLHDDVVDEGEFRRGRPAPRMAFGNGLSVLTGDYCLARSLQAVANTGELVAIRSMSDTVTQMAEGEVAQLHAAGDATLRRDRYLDIIERKTATLIAWCSTVAGLVDGRYVDGLERFGRELGFAFQIADDILDYRTDGLGLAGKSPGQDLREGKMTLPLILACEDDRGLHARILEALAEGPPMPTSVLDEVVAAVLACRAIERSNAIAMGHAHAAIAALDVLPDSQARAALEGVAHYTVRRRQ